MTGTDSQPSSNQELSSSFDLAFIHLFVVDASDSKQNLTQDAVRQSTLVSKINFRFHNLFIYCTCHHIIYINFFITFIFYPVATPVYCHKKNSGIVQKNHFVTFILGVLPEMTTEHSRTGPGGRSSVGRGIEDGTIWVSFTVGQ